LGKTSLFAGWQSISTIPVAEVLMKYLLEIEFDNNH
jgi:hypothetical protein